MKSEIDSETKSVRQWLPPPVPTRDSIRPSKEITDMTWLSNSFQKDHTSERDTLILKNVNTMSAAATATTTTTTTRMSCDYRQHQLAYKKGLIELNRQMALWHARLAQEILQREEQIPSFPNDMVRPRLQDVVVNFFARLNQSLAILDHTNIKSSHHDYHDPPPLQRRMETLQVEIQQLQDQMLLQQSSNLALLQHIKNDLSHTVDDLDSQLHSFQMLSHKREEQMYATLYHYASLGETSLARTMARRYSQLCELETKIQLYTNPSSSNLLWKEIQHLKDRMQEEIQERIRSDQEIIDKIVTNTALVEKLLAMCLDAS